MAISFMKHEAKTTMQLSLPLIIAWLLYSLSGFVGTAMVARLGHDALAASVLVGSIWSIFTTFFFGTFDAASIVIARKYGEKNYPAIGHIMQQAFLASLLASIPFMLGMFFLPFALSFFVPNVQVLHFAAQYARAMMWVSPWLIFLIIFEYFFISIGRTRLSLWISLIEIPLEISLIYIFVFGKGGMPAFGIAGVGYGFAVSYGLTTLVLIIFSYHIKSFKPFQLFTQSWRFDLACIGEILKIGLPIGFMYIIETSTLAIAAFLMIHFGTTTLAAHQIVMQYSSFTMNIIFAMSQIITIRVSQQIGRQDSLGIHKSSYVGIGLTFFCMLLVSVGYFIFPRTLLAIDLDMQDKFNALLIQQAISFLFLLGIFQLVESIRFSTLGALRGLKDTTFPMVVSLVCSLFIGNFFAYLFAFIFHWEGVGIWLGLIAGILLGTIVLFGRLQKKLQLFTLSS